MKEVVFIRHAKSSWEFPKLWDVDRPLATRGQNDILKIGQWFKKEGIKPDLIISSHAKRAFETAKGLSVQCGYMQKIVVSESLYFNGTSAIIGQINQLNDKINLVFLIFHNPDINQICIDNLNARMANIPTLGVVLTKSSTNTWNNWHFENTEIIRIVKPKNLTNT